MRAGQLCNIMPESSLSASAPAPGREVRRDCFSCAGSGSRSPARAFDKGSKYAWAAALRDDDWQGLESRKLPGEKNGRAVSMESLGQLLSQDGHVTMHLWRSFSFPVFSGFEMLSDH